MRKYIAIGGIALLANVFSSKASAQVHMPHEHEPVSLSYGQEPTEDDVCKNIKNVFTAFRTHVTSRANVIRSQCDSITYGQIVDIFEAEAKKSLEDLEDVYGKHRAWADQLTNKYKASYMRQLCLMHLAAFKNYKKDTQRLLGESDQEYEHTLNQSFLDEAIWYDLFEKTDADFWFAQELELQNAMLLKQWDAQDKYNALLFATGYESLMYGY